MLRRRRAAGARPRGHRPTSTGLEADPCGWLRRSCARARCATCTGSATTGCCSSRRTGCRRSTWSCRRPSRTRAACSPGCRGSGSRRRARSSPTTCSRPTPPTSPATSPTATRTSSTTLRGRMMLGRLAEVLPIECVVRGYLSGSGWKAYLDDGAVCGVPLPSGLRESDRLPAPIFTPATKAPMGEHDENIPFESVETLVGAELAARVRGRLARPVPPRRRGRASARASSSRTRSSSSGVLPSGELLLIDEVMTPDSSRFWDAASYQPGRAAGELRQAVRPRLARAAGLGQDAAGPGAAAGRRRRDPRPLRRRLRAHHRRQLRPLPPGGRHRPMSEPTRAYRFAVNVTPKPGILDPQGRAVERSLPHLGIEGVARRPRRAAAWSWRCRRSTRRRRARSSSGWPASCCRTR